ARAGSERFSVHLNSMDKELLNGAHRHWKSFPTSPIKKTRTLIIQHIGNAGRGIRSLLTIPA
ncbi:hypothetical protein, partial [Pseudomonas syringae]|uniref:hypothetical protein n=1 Tax=Pseudomonas syringae TaxID=317 RepID=UPI001FEE47B4